MIIFDLKCRDGHEFEAWFRDNATYEKQRKKGQVPCPICGDTKVVKAPMAPNIATRKNHAAGDAAQDAVKAAATLHMLRKLRGEVEKNSDYVGPQFAEEARKIHYGETEKRSIHGEATKPEEKALQEEGVPFQTIPWIPRTDS